jgi:hypothetical protein
VQEGGAKRKAGRKTSRTTGVKELAVMGDDRLRMGLVPSLPLQLMLDPELKRKVAMADPRVSDIFSKYGPGWSGYQLGLQSNRNKPVVEFESQIKGFPAVGMDLQSHPLAGYLRGSLGPFTGHTGPFGPSGPRNPRDLDALAASAQLGTNVKVMDMDRLPGDAFDVHGEISPFGVGLPDAMRVAGLSKQGRVPRPGQLSGKPESGTGKPGSDTSHDTTSQLPMPPNPTADGAADTIVPFNGFTQEKMDSQWFHVQFILACNLVLQLLLLEHNANKVYESRKDFTNSTGLKLTKEQVLDIHEMVGYTYYNLGNAKEEFAKKMCNFYRNLINATNARQRNRNIYLAERKGYLNQNVKNALGSIETNMKYYCDTESEVMFSPSPQLQPQDRPQPQPQTQTQTQTQSQVKGRAEVKDTPSNLNVIFNNVEKVLEIRDLTTNNYSPLNYMRHMVQTLILAKQEEFFNNIKNFMNDPKNTVFISNYHSNTDLSKENLLSFIKSYNRFIYEIWILNGIYVRFYRVYDNTEQLIHPNESINIPLSKWRRNYINQYKHNDYTE